MGQEHDMKIEISMIASKSKLKRANWIYSMLIQFESEK